MEKIEYEDYLKWLIDNHHFNYDIEKKYYESATYKMKYDFEQSIFFKNLTRNELKKFNYDYYIEKYGYELLVKNDVEICIKSFDSLLNKTFRKNVIFNKNWPNKPDNDWILPSNWYNEINDIIRTRIIVKYLDGVDYLLDKIELLTNANSISCKPHYEARDEGYYACHIYLNYNFELPPKIFDTIIIDSKIEIQITTQLQDIISLMTHKNYEKRRCISNKLTKNKKWQWNYKSNEFIINYLGHILHYLEGMIVDVRDKQNLKEIK